MFAIVVKKNTKCVIIAATNAYRININNLDVKLVSKWDISMTFDLMIQRMGRVGRKGG